jgi:hypothetical protein
MIPIQQYLKLYIFLKGFHVVYLTYVSLQENEYTLQLLSLFQDMSLHYLTFLHEFK